MLILMFSQGKLSKYLMCLFSSLFAFEPASGWLLVLMEREQQAESKTNKSINPVTLESMQSETDVGHYYHTVFL